MQTKQTENVEVKGNLTEEACDELISRFEEKVKEVHTSREAVATKKKNEKEKAAQENQPLEEGIETTLVENSSLLETGEVISKEELDELEITVINKRTHMKGNLESEDSLEMLGSIEGDIKVKGRLHITGSIIGNIEASEIIADGAKITGDIHVSGLSDIGEDTIVVGNIYATSGVIGGAVKGDIEVKDEITLENSSFIIGNVKYQSLYIKKGALIDGTLKNISDIDVDSMFTRKKDKED